MLMRALALVALFLPVLLASRGGGTTTLAPSLSKAREDASQRGENAAALCAAFGFGSRSRLESATSAISDDMVVVPLEADGDMALLGDLEACVGYVNALHLASSSSHSSGIVSIGGNGGSNTIRESPLLASFVSLLQALQVGSNEGHDEPCRVAVLAGGCGDGSNKQDAPRLKKAEAQIRSLLREATKIHAATRPARGAGQRAEDRVSLVVIAASADKLPQRLRTALVDADAALGSSIDRRTGEQVATDILDAASARRASSPPGAAAVGAEADLSGEYGSSAALRTTDMLACFAICNTFTEELGLQLTILGTQVPAAADLEGAVQAAAEAAEEAHLTTLAEQGNSRGMKEVATRARSALAAELHVPFAKNVDMLYAEALSSFEALARRVPANSKLTRGLRMRAHTVVENFTKNINTLRTEFMGVVELEGPGLLSPALSDGNKGSASASIGFTATADINRLRLELRERCTERVGSMFLQGVYNPYVREAPWAPTHININYLLDPRGLELLLDYDKLYDEHREGPAPHRAMGIPLPGVSQLAFNPNVHPEPKDKRNWLQTLKDFYYYDDDAEFEE